MAKRSRKHARRSSFERLEHRQFFSGVVAPLPSPWTDSDIGAVGKAGSAGIDVNGNFVVSGGGADVWGSADAFNYASQPLSGNGTVVAQVTSETNTSGWAKAGVMIRSDLSTGSTYAFLMVSPSNGISFQDRTVAKTTPSTQSVAGVTPEWVEIVRTGQQFKGYYSTDGVNWTADGTVTLPGSGTMYAGIAVCAHNNAALCTATFSGAAVNAAFVPTVVPRAPTSLSATATSSTQVQLQWTDADATATSFIVQRQGPTDASFVNIATVAASATTYTDTTASANATYAYQLVAVNPIGLSLPSAPASETTPLAPVTPWSDSDIGAVGLPGSAVQTGSTIAVAGAGTDIWNATDIFNFDSQSFVGNGTIVAHLVGNSTTNSGSKAGIMLRETTAIDSRYVDIVITPAGTIKFEDRTATHNTPTSIAVYQHSNTWLQLSRSGSTFTGAYSTNGVTWTAFGTATIPMANNIQAGLCICSHNNTQLATATFNSVSVTYDSTAASIWTDAADAPMARWESQSVTYNNELYIFGGFVDRTLDSTSECDVYNPATNGWSHFTDVPTGGLTHAGAAMVGDTLYLAGGDVGTFTQGKTLTATSQVLTYDFDTSQWGSITPLPVPVSCGGFVAINSVLYYYGGLNVKDTADVSATYSFDLNNPSAGWVSEAPMPNARNHVGYAEVNGIAYAIGGQHLYKESTGNVAEVDAYNPITNTWAQVASLPQTLSSFHVSTFVVNGKIAILGGQTNGGYDGIYQNSIEEFDPVANTWTSMGSLPEANEGLTAAYINGELIGVGGTVDNLGGWAQMQTWTTDDITL